MKINKNLKILVMLLMSILPMQLSAANTAPVAQDDSVTGEKNKEIIFTISDLVSPNDTDPDGDTLVLLNVFDPINGIVDFNKSNGKITFIPNADFTGEASFNYTIVDRIILDTDIPIPTIDFIDSKSTVNPVIESDTQSPEINGTCEAGYTVTLQIDGTAIEPTAVCDSSGKYSIVLATPVEKIVLHSVTVTQLSPSNRVSDVVIGRAVRKFYSGTDTNP